jgi:hypothetical protein
MTHEEDIVMPEKDAINTSNPFRIVTKILLDIANDEEEYARLYDEVRGQGGLKEDREKARKNDRQYLLGLLNRDLAPIETIEQITNNR